MKRDPNEIGPPHVSEEARKLWLAAIQNCFERKWCYPAWGSVITGQSDEVRYAAFDELNDAGVVFSGWPSLICALDEVWPLDGRPRPGSHEWRRLIKQVFERDDYTCTYCGARGVKLQCDHIDPVSRGGSSELDNLTTACEPCNRSKGAKRLEEWRR